MMVPWQQTEMAGRTPDHQAASLQYLIITNPSCAFNITHSIIN